LTEIKIYSSGLSLRESTLIDDILSRLGLSLSSRVLKTTKNIWDSRQFVKMDEYGRSQSITKLEYSLTCRGIQKVKDAVFKELADRKRFPNIERTAYE
jgi:hypothetical protein